MRPIAYLAMNRDRYDDVCAPEHRAALEASFQLIGPFGSTPTVEEIREGAAPATVIFTSWGTPTLTGDVLDSARDLRVIAHAAGTVKHLVPREAFGRGIGVFTAGPRIAESVGEYCLAAMLTLARRLPSFDHALRGGAWHAGVDRGREIRGARVGIIGASSTARALIRLLAAFDAHVVVYDPYLSPDRAAELGVTLVTLEQALASPFVSVHVPSTPDTEGMITAELIARVPEGAVFVNSSRGDVLDQEALYDRIEAGTIHAAMDVFATEPADLPARIVEARNGVFTPHVAGDTADGHGALLGVVAADAAAWLADGTRGETFVDVARWEVSA